jgi:hypothetical protein
MQRYSPANPLLPSEFWGTENGAIPESTVVYGDARLGDAADRRKTFGNIRTQPLLSGATDLLSTTNNRMDSGKQAMWKDLLAGHEARLPFL